MEKNWLMAVVMAGFAGMAQASSSVTLYGALDTAVGYERTKQHATGVTQKRTGFFNGIETGNHWGLKGTEDLGQGLRATFQLESGFDLTDGQSSQGGRLFGRHATVGLTGESWGEIRVGLQKSVSSLFFVELDDQGWEGTGSSAVFTGMDSYRVDNAVMYFSPEYDGFQFGAGYSFNVDGAQAPKINGQPDSNQRFFTTGLSYNKGPLSAALTYDQVRLPNVNTVNNYKNAQGWSISGSYDFAVVSVAVAFGQDFNSKLGRDEFYRKDFRYDNYSVALAVPLGHGRLTGNYAISAPRKAAKDSGEKNMQSYSLAYSYPFSKRTSLYALGAYTQNYMQINKDTNTIGVVGIRHNF